MSTDMALSIFCPMLLILGMSIGYTLFKALHQCPRMSEGHRRKLEYVCMLLGNYYDAHVNQSALTGVEIEEVLRLCKAEVDKVLEG